MRTGYTISCDTPDSEEITLEFLNLDPTTLGTGEPVHPITAIKTSGPVRTFNDEGVVISYEIKRIYSEAIQAYLKATGMLEADITIPKSLQKPKESTP